MATMVAPILAVGQGVVVDGAVLVYPISTFGLEGLIPHLSVLRSSRVHVSHILQFHLLVRFTKLPCKRLNTRISI